MIWRWADAYSVPVPTPHRLSLGEGGTPLVDVPSLAAAIGIASLRVKRDDLSPGGSHKSRSLAYRLSVARSRGEETVLLSSSGNAAVAASLFCAAAGVRLLAFVSPGTAAVKLSALRRQGTVVVRSPKPRNFARYVSRVFAVPNLTPSLDDLSIEGFKSIGLELSEQAPDATDFFSFVTSGSSFLGVAATLQASLHIVQAGASAQLAAPFDPRQLPPSRLAGLLGIDESPRAEAVRAAARHGWVLGDDDIRQAHGWLRDCGIDTSGEGAACVAAVARARRAQALTADARVVVLLSGHASQWSEVATAEETCDAESYVDLRALLMERYAMVPQ